MLFCRYCICKQISGFLIMHCLLLPPPPSKVETTTKNPVGFEILDCFQYSLRGLLLNRRLSCHIYSNYDLFTRGYFLQLLQYTEEEYLKNARFG